MQAIPVKIMTDTSTTFELNEAMSLYYKGLVLSRMGHGERALISFREALVAELERDHPDGLNLRLFRDKIREVEAALFPPEPPTANSPSTTCPG